MFHEYSDTVDPSTAPPAVNLHWCNTSTGDVFTSKGTGSSADWVKLQDAATAGSTTDGLDQFAATTSAELAGVISDETGTGALVFATSPTLVTPTLGVASATSVAVGAGSTSAPGLTFGDSDTGFYAHLSGGISVSNNGAQSFRFHSDGSTSCYGPYFLLDYYMILGSSADVSVYRDGIGALGLINYSSSSSPTALRVYNKAGTDYERGVFDWQTTADTLTIGTQKGGAGSARGISFVVGGATAGGFTTAGVFTTASSTLHATSVALANGAAAAAGTLTNAPTAGNPTKWIPIDDNGTTRYIPAW